MRSLYRIRVNKLQKLKRRKVAESLANFAHDNMNRHENPYTSSNQV